MTDRGRLERSAAAFGVHQVQCAARIEGELRCVRIAGCHCRRLGRTEAPATIARKRDPDVGCGVVARRPRQHHRMIGSDREGRRARGRSGRIARHQQGLGEVATTVAGAGDPESAVVLGPGGEHLPTRCGCDVEAAVVPRVAVDATLAVTCPRPRQVHWRSEGTAAVTGDGKQDLAAVRPPGEDDLLPEHMKAAGIIRCPRKPRQPGEGLGLPRDVHWSGQQRVSVGGVALQQHGLPTLVDPSYRELASRAPRDGGIVHEVVARLVLLPHAAFAGAAHDLQRGLPADLPGPAGARAEQQRSHQWRPRKPACAGLRRVRQLIGRQIDIHLTTRGRKARMSAILLARPPGTTAPGRQPFRPGIAWHATSA